MPPPMRWPAPKIVRHMDEPGVSTAFLTRLDHLEREVNELRAALRHHRPHLVSGAADLCARWALIARDLATADAATLVQLVRSIEGALQQGRVFLGTVEQTIVFDTGGCG